MSRAVFSFEKASSKIFGTVYRPIASANFWSRRLREWQEVIAIVDTGADYTLLPRFYADDFGINVKTECMRKTTRGIGGGEIVFLCKKMKVNFLGQTFSTPVGFINRDDLPPVFGRQKFIDRFKVTFHLHQTIFEC